ncbi:hypothetical protein [Actinocrispum sp. NPDC049592]|uniref:hypothetical protein n=1 Tax=Actinocrispum sp. NPDC049592 TaxID=3154835 RepID=UPI0034133BDF
MQTVDVKLVGGRRHGEIVQVLLTKEGTPCSPMAWPAMEIPWCPLLVYELDGQDANGTWIFRYRNAHYGGW